MRIDLISIRIKYLGCFGTLSKVGFVLNFGVDLCTFKTNKLNKTFEIEIMKFRYSCYFKAYCLLISDLIFCNFTTSLSFPIHALSLILEPANANACAFYSISFNLSNRLGTTRNARNSRKMEKESP